MTRNAGWQRRTPEQARTAILDAAEALAERLEGSPHQPSAESGKT